MAWTKTVDCKRMLSAGKLSVLFMKQTSFTKRCLENLKVAVISCHIHHSARNENLQYKKFVKKIVSADSSQKVLSNLYLKTLLLKCESVADQIKVFHSYVSLEDTDVAIRQSLCQEMENTLKPFIPECSVRLVGSSANGFGLKGCDVDLSFQYTSLNGSEAELKENNTKGISYDDILSGNVSTSAFPLLHVKEQLLFIQNTLKRSNNSYGTFKVIPGRCPILNFSFQQLNCDLAINNKSALQGTNLMLMCGKLDLRVAPLLKIISYWAKQANLVGGPAKFKSYAIFLLVIYFLQTRNPPVLPTVNEMFHKTGFLQNLGNWSWDVCDHIGKFESSKNSQSIEELFREFFFYYGNFDFSWVICTTNASVVHQSSYLKEFSKFGLNTICIQDPLNPEWNVATDVIFKYCKHFIKGVISACELYQEKWNSSSTENWGLAALIDMQTSSKSIKNLKMVTISIPLLDVVSSVSSVKSHSELLIKAAENLMYIFDYCMLFSCTILKSDDLSAFQEQNAVKTADKKLIKRRMSLQSDTNSVQSDVLLSKNEDIAECDLPGLLISRFMCVTSDTWHGRSSLCARSVNNNSLYFEHEISKEISEYRKGQEKKAFQFLCECRGIHTDDNCTLYLTLKPVNSDTFVPKLAIFLKEYVPKLLTESLYHTYSELKPL